MNMQLPLGIGLRDSARLDNFLAGPNLEAVQALRAVAAGKGESPLYLWGAAGSGKSHLLQAACRAADLHAQQSAYLPLEQVSAYSPDVLEGLESLPLVCLDDLQALAGLADWQEALFHCFNRLRENGGRLVVAADARPTELGFGLADLVSRLGWGLVYPLQGLDDDERLAALQLRARGRGLDLPDETGRYLLRRMPRDLPALFSLLDELDHASLVAQRRLTIPFVKDVLGS